MEGLLHLTKALTSVWIFNKEIEWVPCRRVFITGEGRGGGRTSKPLIPLCETTQQLLHKNGGNLGLWIFHFLNSQVMFQKVCVLYYWTASIIQALLNCQLSKATFPALSKGRDALAASCQRVDWWQRSWSPSAVSLCQSSLYSEPIKLSIPLFYENMGNKWTKGRLNLKLFLNDTINLKVMFYERGNRKTHSVVNNRYNENTRPVINNR